MNQVWKDSGRKSIDRIVLKVGTNNDGTYEITVNDEVVGRWIAEKWLDEELCAKRGFCGEDYILPFHDSTFECVAPRI